MKLPDLPQKGGSIREDYEAIVRYLRAITVVGIAGGRVQQGPNGTTLFPGRLGVSGEDGGESTECPFGEIVNWTEGETEKTGLRGGVIYCGDKNFNVSRKAYSLASDGDWLIYLQLDCESNRDDDNEIILPGIKTSSETDPSTFWTSTAWSAGPPETQYPDNTNPTVVDGIGTIIIPLGRLVIATGVASFTKVACGNVTVGQCGGVLSHTRG